MFERYKIVIASLIFLLVVIVGLIIGVIVLGIARKGKHIESKQLTVVCYCFVSLQATAFFESVSVQAVYKNLLLEYYKVAFKGWTL